MIPGEITIKKATNTDKYVDLLNQCLATPCAENKHGICGELLGVQKRFAALEHIMGSSENYIEHELDWYKSLDLCIFNHDGIRNNKVWQSCATKDGHVNSNYGWCIWSKDNYEQFKHARDSIIDDNMTKQAVMIYSRPSIVDEWNDGVHANHDMICTIYTSFLLRDGKLHHHVHMRSNDIWYGLRNDLAWQQHVQRVMVNELIVAGIKCTYGDIVWNADSLHLYERNKKEAQLFVRDYNNAASKMK